MVPLLGSAIYSRDHHSYTLFLHANFSPGLLQVICSLQRARRAGHLCLQLPLLGLSLLERLQQGAAASSCFGSCRFSSGVCCRQLCFDGVKRCSSFFLSNFQLRGSFIAGGLQLRGGIGVRGGQRCSGSLRGGSSLGGGGG